MSWVKLDDQFTDHPKVVEAGPMAAWLYVCGLTYCARQLTDGFIPTAQLRRLLPTGSVAKLAKRLVEVRLWETAAGGYVVHDYLIYNATREQTLALRQQRASAGRKGGWQKAGKLPGGGQPVATTPVPQPVPIPNNEVGKPTSAPPAARAEVRAVPKPSEAAAVVSQHQELFAALVARFKPPANDAERRKFGSAAKLLAQADVTPEEVGVLADALEERWQHAECTPLAIANNVTTLRTPARTPAVHPARNGRPPPFQTNLAALAATTRKLELERGEGP